MPISREVESEIFARFYVPGAHSDAHALLVAQNTQSTARQPEYERLQLTDEYLDVVYLAAIFHDVGYTFLKAEFMSETKEEHSYYSVQAFLEYCQESGMYATEPYKKWLVSWLIFNHDNTQYRFPAHQFFRREYYGRQQALTPISIADMEPGTVREVPKSLLSSPELSSVEQSEIEVALLQILQESDGLTGTASRTLDFAKSRGVPITTQESPWTYGVGRLAWQGSGLASAYLAALRGVLDSATEAGFVKAIEMYQATVEVIHAEIEQANPGKNAEKIFAPLSSRQLEFIQQKRSKSHNRWRYYDWQNDTFIGQAIPPTLLSPDVTAAIYANGRMENNSLISTFSVAGSLLMPTENLRYAGARTVNKEQVVRIKTLYEQILHQYGIDIFTHIHGGVLIQTLDIDPVLGTEQHTNKVFSPVAVIDNQSKRLGRSPQKLEVFTGTSWLETARTLGHSMIRVLLAEPDQYNGYGQTSF